MGDQERHDTRHVGLESNQHHVGEKFEVLREVRRHAVRLIHARIDLRVIFFSLLQLAFYFTNGGKIFVELALIRGSERGFQFLCVRSDEIQNALAVFGLAGSLLRAQDGAIPEETFEKHAGIQGRRQRLRFTAPREVICVGAGVAGIAIAGLARVVHAEFDGRKARLTADLVGDNLVERNAGLDVDQGLLDLNAG